MRIKEMPTSGFITRTGRKVYGQDDYNRDKKIVLIAAVIVIGIGLFLAIGREF